MFGVVADNSEFRCKMRFTLPVTKSGCLALLGFERVCELNAVRAENKMARGEPLKKSRL